MREQNQHHEHGHGQGHGPWGEGRHGFRWGGEHHGPHGRGRWHGRGPGRHREDWFGGEGWNWGGFGGGFGGGRERLERGLLRHVILSVLKDGPKHGYEVIKHLEEKTNGWYSPSPGTLYPTLQLLEDTGHVRSEQENDKRVYHLTEAGHAELDKQHSLVEGFWERFRERAASGAHLHEMRFAGDAMKDLLRTIGNGIRSSAIAQDPDAIRKIRAALERCQNEIRDILASSASSRQSPGATDTRASGSGEEGYV